MTHQELIRRLKRWEAEHGVTPSGKGESHCRSCGLMTYVGFEETEQHHGDCAILLVRDVLEALRADALAEAGDRS